MESKMLEALRRYIQDYGWNWGIVHSLINRKFGTDYTLEELQHFYIRRAWPQPGKARTVSKSPHSQPPRRAALAASRVLFIAAAPLAAPCRGAPDAV